MGDIRVDAELCRRGPGYALAHIDLGDIRVSNLCRGVSFRVKVARAVAFKVVVTG